MQFVQIRQSILERAAAAVGAMLLLYSGHVAAAEDPLAAIEKQAAVLDAAPRLAAGEQPFSAEAMSGGAFAWIEVKEPGYYTLRLSTPGGALILASFPTPEGAYDGHTAPKRHAASTSLDSSPEIGPLLLDNSHPYIVSVSGSSAGTLSVTQSGTIPALASAPAEGTVFTSGEMAWRVAERVELSLPASADPQSVEVVTEPRAELRARLGSMDIRSGGLYPWAHDEAADLSITASVPKGTPPALVHVRVAPAPGGLDETEPNERKPDTLVVGTPFRGALLANRDTDMLALSLAETAHLTVSADFEVPWVRFSATLLGMSEGRGEAVWQRKPAGGSLNDAALTLAPGDYRLQLTREDGRDAAARYTVRLSAGDAPRANREVEPNDRPTSAMAMPESMRVSGSATPDDLDVFRFTVPDEKAQHLWRVFTVGADRIELEDDDGRLADVRATGRRSMADALALVPGDYRVTVHADGDYLLRVMDLGARPSDYEGEPNDTFADGQRLVFGSGMRGGFHRDQDYDYYLFRLDAASPVEINIRPAGDGKMDVKLFLGNRQVGQRVAFAPGDGPYTFRSTLPAGDWALAVRALEPAIQNQYEVSVSRLAALAGNEPDDDPLNASKLPRDGDFAGSVGAFDGADQVFVPLPEGEGAAAMICSDDSATRPGRWRLYHWSDDSKITDVRDGIGIFAYGPELGGAVRFGLDGTEEVIAYDCALRFPPLTAPAAGTPPAAPAGEAPVPMAPGQTSRATVTADGPEPLFAMDIEEGAIGFVDCRGVDGSVIGPDTRVWELRDVGSPSRDLLGTLRPFVAGAEPVLALRKVYAERYAEGALPLDVDCTLYGVDDLPRPSDMGPAAEFRIVRKPDPASPGSAAPSGPPPPGLEALINREVAGQQPQGDLPVRIAIDQPAELAAFNPAGQRLEVGATLTSDADTALPVAVAFDVRGEGWRVTPRTQQLTLTPGEPARVSAQLVAPPWLSPALRPGVLLKAEAADAFAAERVELPVSADALPVDPFTYWHAPDALRGGLNVLHYGLGARLIDWGGQTPDENLQKGESLVHDGLAPHIGGINVPKDIAFRLAAVAEVAGVMIQLRSVTSPERWPAAVEVYAPDGDDWRRVAAALLKTVHSPQYLVFDAPVTTDRLRFTFPRCHEPCRQVFLQEIQAIAVPGTHPDGLGPINAADLGLGGHVVWANHDFGGQWNSEFLTAEPERSNNGWPRNDKLPVLQATLAFHQNRAALVDSIAWVGDPDDTERMAGATLEASLDSPGGPWTKLGQLPAPPLGEVRASLDFDEPVWVRYLRLSFEPAADRTLYGPDGIEVIESRGTSVLALWEDDQPRAAYEASIGAEPMAPVPPIGGPDRDNAVPLPLGTLIESSVVIERNEDWWRLAVPPGPPSRLQLAFQRQRPVVVAGLSDADGTPVPLEAAVGERVLEAILVPGEYALRVYEPPRSVVISWDSSGSVSKYIPRTLAAVRTWGRSLKPGRDALQLLPFGPKGFILDDWAETPEAIEPALRALPEEESSNSEKAMQEAAEALADRRGARGIVIMTDAQTGMNDDLWPSLLEAMPRVVSLSVDSDSRQNAAIMMDWAALNGGRFQRVVGPLGLADGMDMANALFRAPKAYGLTATLEELVEPEGEAQLSIRAVEGNAAASGAVELILDASGSMLQRMEGRRRIDIAHDALTSLVREILPGGMPFAFRAFGLEEDACRSELIVPLGPLDRDSAADAIEGVPAINLARTAIADSLRAAAGDLAGSSAPRVVVLVTDGEETCEGDPAAAIEELRASGLDARVNIVGFAIDDAALAETFSTWAEAGGGTYFDARGAEALEQSIADALRPRFDITRTYLDGRTEAVARVALGETVTVPAGRLTIAPGSAASGSSVTLDVVGDESVLLQYEHGAGLRGAGDAPPSN